MILIVTLDNLGGMLFNHRRQSQDAVLRERILAVTKGHSLWMNGYSVKQFAEMHTDSIRIAEDCLTKAGKSEFCFVEDLPAAAYEPKIERILVFKWNRTYPADLRFDIDLRRWKLQSTMDFKGSSHEKITEEVYIR